MACIHFIGEETIERTHLKKLILQEIIYDADNESIRSLRKALEAGRLQINQVFYGDVSPEL